MKTVDDCIEKAIRGFDGSRFYLSYFNGESYLSLIDDTMLLLSKKSISEKSVSKRFGFMTEVCLDELQDITSSRWKKGCRPYRYSKDKRTFRINIADDR